MKIEARIVTVFVILKLRHVSGLFSGFRKIIVTSDESVAILCEIWNKPIRNNYSSKTLRKLVINIRLGRF